MSHEKGDLIQVRLPPDVSYQWFHAEIVEDRGSIVVVDLMFEIAGRTRWIVKPNDIRRMKGKIVKPMTGTLTMRGELKKILKR